MARSAIISVFAEAVLDQRLAVMLGATFVVGAPEALARLGDAEEAIALERAQADYAHTGLSDEAIRWLAIGEQGLSSRAMFNHITGISPRRYQPDQGGAIPHDSDDFRRCYELYCAVPEIADGLERLRSLSAHWAALVDRWDELAGLFENEEWAALTQQLKEAAGKHNPSGPMAPGM